MVKEGEKEVLLAVSGGFIEFHENKLVVLADTAERAEEIDLKRAQEARKKAQKLRSKVIATDEAEYARVLVALQKQSARIRVATRYRNRSN
jgi:F-type H+-transporting ATPase subunit epsilon